MLCYVIRTQKHDILSLPLPPRHLTSHHDTTHPPTHQIADFLRGSGRDAERGGDVREREVTVVDVEMWGEAKKKVGPGGGWRDKKKNPAERN